MRQPALRPRALSLSATLFSATPFSTLFFSTTFVGAALGLAPCRHAAAEVVPERGSISFRYLDYVDRQPDLERIRIGAPAVQLTVPVAGAWQVDGSYVADAVSGASPAYHTVARSAAKIIDRREAVSAGLTRYWPGGTFKAGAAYSTESDYVSRALSAQGSVSSDDKNTTFNFGVGITRDVINPVNKRTTDETRRTYEATLGITQVLTPVDLVQLSLSLAQGRGYFSDPYKLLDERPRQRDQRIVMLRWNHHFESVEGTTRVSYRHYTDTWDVKAHTLTLEYVQPLGTGWTLTPLVRFHSQGAARFYRDVNPAAPTRISVPPNYEPGVTELSFDQRLSALGARTFGLKVAKQINADWQVDVKFERYEQRSGWYLGGSGSPGLANFSARMVQAGFTRQF
jgi:Protein of unknown function (DUF3570)